MCRGSDVMRIGRGTVASKFSVDGRTASEGVREFFEDEDGGAFANDKAVAGFIEGAGGLLWGVIVRSGEGMGALEAGEGEGVDAGFGAAG